ncbi:DUF624 domain-containing protein [Gracilibacillus marinus]|uniref:DUF624 domain-containing protein n=1 Tax=Gracilibacillus marinus TaxID=630535 RepID=A0ABV8W031_9BACI
MNIYTNKLYVLLEKITNFFLLNLLWLICSLPIITIFPASSAMFHVINEWRVNGKSSIVKPFFLGLKKNFKLSFFSGLFFIISFLILYYDLLLIHELLHGWAYLVTLSLLFFLMIVLAFIATYSIPTIVFYHLSFKETIKQSFLFSFIFFPTTILMILLFIGFVLIVLFYPIAIFLLISPIFYAFHKLVERNRRQIQQI